MGKLATRTTGGTRLVPRERVKVLELRRQGEIEPGEVIYEVTPQGPRDLSGAWPSPLWLLLVPAVLLLAIALVARQRRRTEPVGPRRVLHVKVNGQEQRWALPTTLTVGSAETDAVRVPGARSHELRLKVGGRGDGAFRHNGARGGFFGGRDFKLSNGVAVQVRAEEMARTERETHRYLAAG